MKNIKILLVVIIHVVLATALWGQEAGTFTYKFAVRFIDKEGTPFSVEQPASFLSQRAIDRRTKYGIEITETDLPIQPEYIEQVLQAAPAAHLSLRVKWLNTIVLGMNDSSHMAAVRALPVVDSVALVFNDFWAKSANQAKFETDFTPLSVSQPSLIKEAYDSAFYGGAWVQVHQLGCEVLHRNGQRGSGMFIAVLDGGFNHVDDFQAFARLRNNNQIIGTCNLVNPGASVYEDTHTHGTSVLSCMGGYWEGELIGTAPDADYCLIVTEDVNSEFVVEEYNWVAGAAYADSIGADMINSSLGYVAFDDSSQDYTYADLNGYSSIVTQGANMAAEKGILVVNSAGNDGSNPWRHIGVPADAPNIITVGAVDRYGEIASFSSVGCSWLDYIKPNVVARGAGTCLASGQIDEIVYSNGTSFSSPVLAGAIASMWSIAPKVHPQTIKAIVEQSANNYYTPDTVYGYGLPNMSCAMTFLGFAEDEKVKPVLNLYPNPAHSFIACGIEGEYAVTQYAQVKLYNAQAILVKEIKVKAFQPIDISDLAVGLYIVELKHEGRVFVNKFIKQ